MKADHCLKSEEPWTSSEIAWALDRELIGLDALKEYVGSQEGGAGFPDLDVLLVRAELAPLSAKEPISLGLTGQENDRIARKWLLAVLDDLYSRRNELADPLGEVEMVYADFDYPDCMESFVRYMPPSDGYDPAQHTFDQNVRRLMDNWAGFLASSK